MGLVAIISLIDGSARHCFMLSANETFFCPGWSMLSNVNIASYCLKMFSVLDMQMSSLK